MYNYTVIQLYIKNYILELFVIAAIALLRLPNSLRT